MKKNLLLALFAVLSISVCAQEKYDPRDHGNVLLKTVGAKWKIKDKIIVINRSPYMIEQVMVAEIVGNELKPLGSCTDLFPDDDCEVAIFAKNSLKYLKGKTIAIKAKGLKSESGSKSHTKVKTPFGSVGVRSQDKEGVSPEDYTYEFEAKLFESKHDLIIELYNANGQNIMDF